jgi:membrane protease YdiL (CAAX protease family)
MTESALHAPERAAGALAPRWHTAALVALLLTVAFTGTLLQHCASPPGASRAVSPASGSRIFVLYLPLLIVNGGLALYCCRLFRRHNALPALLGHRWPSPARACGDLALALLGCAFVACVELVCARLFGVGHNAAISALLPNTGVERLAWVLVAVSVGFCEEVVYRGYLQTQLSAFTGHPTFGVVLQALLFGLAHLEQGPYAASRIAIYGLVFGGLAWARRSLLPGILCHVGIDLVSGLLR